ncbi:MAG: phage tail spike protein [Clostridia bacterium]|nr:phage tail spike protein [Clostridia bacterium]
MICIFDKFATDFSGNGIGPLCPSSCEVSETLNGEYELTMVHPLDALGKWQRIESGRILRVPVPSAMTPHVHLITQTATEIYKTNGSSRPIRSSTSTKGKVLAKYKKNKHVALIEKTSSTWYLVVGPDGKQGYMQKSHLTYVRTDYSLAEATGEVVEPSQQRDQPFRIYRVVPELDKLTVYARHIFYDLLDNMIKSYKPNKARIGSVVVQGISDSCLSEHDFTFYSDLDSAADEEALDDDTNTGDFVNINPVDALIGDSGVVHFYGGELARDWFDVYLIKRVGLDSGVQIREGKNLLGINYDVDDTDVITRIMPTGEDKDGELLYLPEIYVDSPHVDEYPNARWSHLAVEDCKENPKKTKDNPKKTREQCYTQMRNAAQKEFDNGCDLPKVTLTVDFINCAETEEYRQYGHLQNIYLGDGVRVITKRLGIAVTLRMTEYSFDCLTRKYTKMTLGTVADGLEANTISPRQIPAGSITGSKIAINSVGIGQLQDGSVGSLQIQDAAIGNTHIQHAAIEQAHIAEAAITYAHIAQACVEALTSGSLEAMTAKIQHLEASDIQTDTLAAALASFTVITAGTATFDAATVQHLVAEALNLEFGVGDDVFINNLKVAYAQVVSAAIGNLCIKASDGFYYTIDVDADGKVTASKTTVTQDEIASGQTESGAVILETDITAASLNTGNLMATYALVNKIDAARIDVGTLMARQALIDALYTSQIYGGQSLEFIIGSQNNAIQAAKDAADAAVAQVQVLYASGPSSAVAPAAGWSTVAPAHQEGQYIWQKTVTTFNNGATESSMPTCLSGADGEPATTLRIDSSRGTVFKNNAVSTVLSAVIYRGGVRITDMNTLRSTFGSGAYLQWSWQRIDEERFGVISASDSRLINDGFSFVLSADDVDTKVTFMCELITN